MPPRPIQRVAAYVRVSTDDQAAGIEAQRQAIEAKCTSKGWQVEWYTDKASGRSMLRRPALQKALVELRHRRADALVVAKLDRLSRSVVDFGNMVELARAQGWHLVMLDLEIDTSTPMGEVMATMAVAFAQFERRMIGLRTKEALAVKRAQGVHLGRPRVIEPRHEDLIRHLRRRGHSYQGIADQMNQDGLPAPQGGRWGWTTISRVVARG